MQSRIGDLKFDFQSNLTDFLPAETVLNVDWSVLDCVNE